jgi:putative hydrolase of the HAD superfamily
MSFSAVIFDIGNVLVEWRPHDIVRCAMQIDDPEGFSADFFGGQIWRDLNLGRISEPDARSLYVSEKGMSVSQVNALFEEIDRSQVVIAETVPFMPALKAKGKSVYGLSNNVSENIGRLKLRHDFFGHFDDLLLSCDVNLLKPGRAIFDLACEKWAIKPETTVFIDDHAPNIDSAKALGFQTVLFESPRQLNALMD